MKRERGYTLIETMIVITIVAILSAAGLYGWRGWQQQQRLWQTAVQVREYLVLLRDDANWHNRDRPIAIHKEGNHACLVSADVEGCPSGDPWTLHPQWPEVQLADITPGLAFFGLRNTAWAGHVRLQSPAGSWMVVVSGWGRIRLCQPAEENTCL